MSVDVVRKHFSQWGMEHRIRELPLSSATVEEAAAALGCEGCRIAKTLSFLVEGRPVLIVMAGDAKVDNAKYKEQFHAKAVMLRGDEVETLTGHPVGGVCPFGVGADVAVYLDRSLQRFETVYPACGSRNSAIELTLAELETCSGSMGWIDVGKGWV